MNHVFIPIANGLTCYELRFNGERELIDKWRAVCPTVMPENEVLVGSWMPPRRDRDGNLLETDRLRIYRVPMGKNGPLISQIARILNDLEMPQEVKAPEAMVIDPVLKNLTTPEECEIVAARMGVNLPRGADVPAMRTLLQREGNNTTRGKDVLKDLKEKAARATKKPEQAAS